MNNEPQINVTTGTSVVGPPKKTVGVGSWLKTNLFGTWPNIILTIVSTAIILYVVFHTGKFIFTADWNVIETNFRLLMVGQFPLEETWRVWVAIFLISALLGSSWGLWRGVMKHVALVIGGLMVVSLVLPFIQTNTRLILVGNIICIFLFYIIGRKVKKLKIPVLLLWILFIPLVISLFNGFGILPKVNSNIWGGFLLTLLIASVAIVCSFPLGVLLALGRRSKLPVVKWFCIIYIELIRGIPLITILFVFQLMLPLFLGNSIDVSNVLRAMVGFTLFSAAYLAENIRGGLQSIPRGQFEAAQALGLNSTYTMGFVVLPQAIKAVIPACVGQFISIFKDTSLVAIVGLTELLGMGQKVIANPAFLGKNMEVFLFIAFIYFIFCSLMSYVSRRLENTLGAGER
ncbi:amino acid ABC transporter permease [Cytobacillus sp. FSL R7-0696]|uniref:amino acid ABC transporter permease n=1 Tax=Cytobacillus sp. FSL R7-0696 TaxID=2921691 RepID=UPI0030FAC243